MLSAESSTPKPDEKEQVAPVDKAAPSSQDHSNTNTNTNTGTNTADQIDAGTANTGAATSYPTSKQDVPCKEDDKDQTSGTQDEQEQDITSPQACTSSSGCFPATSSGQKDGHDDWTHVRVQTASGQFDTDGRRVIAIAVDESDHSEYAFEWAMKHIVQPESDQVVLLNTWEVTAMPLGLASMALIDMAAASDAESRQASHILLRKFGTKLMKAQIKCRAISLRGDPRDEIVHKCIDIDPVMLVVGSRGMTGLKRVFVGSTSDHLVHHSPCPVVVVHRHHRPADEQEHHRRHLFHRDRDDTDKQKQKEEKEQQEAPVSA